MSMGGKSNRDIDAREAEISGKQQRLASLTPEELAKDESGLIAQIGKPYGIVVEPTQVPEVYQLMLKHSDLFRCQLTIMGFLKTGALSLRERELAITRLAWRAGAPYSFGEHVQLAKKCGITDQEIERITAGGAAEPGWSEHERAILAAVDELFDNQMISDPTWDILARSWSEHQLIEFPQLVGQYFAAALQQNSLRLRLAPHNKGLKSR